MRGHIHTDVVAAIYGAIATLLVFHAMRTAGAWMAAHGATKPGTVLGGLATFN